MSIGLAYTSGTSYNVVFEEFRGAEFPRSYEGSATFGRSASGATSISGGGTQKRIWAISANISHADALELDNMFQAWDTDRANGNSAACGLTDETFLGTTYNTNVVFSTPPSFVYLSPQLVAVDFAVTQV